MGRSAKAPGEEAEYYLEAAGTSSPEDKFMSFWDAVRKLMWSAFSAVLRYLETVNMLSGGIIPEPPSSPGQRHAFIKNPTTLKVFC